MKFLKAILAVGAAGAAGGAVGGFIGGDMSSARWGALGGLVGGSIAAAGVSAFDAIDTEHKAAETSHRTHGPFRRAMGPQLGLRMDTSPPTGDTIDVQAGDAALPFSVKPI